MAQGQQRGVDATGKVFPFQEPSPQLLVRPAVYLSAQFDVKSLQCGSSTGADLLILSCKVGCLELDM